MNSILKRIYKKFAFPKFVPESSRSVVWFSVLMVLTISILNLTGWKFNIDLFKGIEASWIPMSVITALCFGFTAMALMVILTGKPYSFRIIFPNVIAILLILVSLLMLFVNISFLFRGTEFSFVNAPLLNLFLENRARMPLKSGAGFLMIGCILLLLTKNTPHASYFSHILLFPTFIISYIIIVSYLLLGKPLIVFHNVVADALNTGIAFCLTCTAILFIRPDSWLMNVFTSKNAGGMMARKLLPALLALPLVIGWLRIMGERSGLFESEEGVVLVAITYTVSFILLVWKSAISVNKSDEVLKKEINEHRITEYALKASESQVKMKLESILSPEGKIDDLELSDIINVKEIQCMMDNFYRFSKIPMGIVDLKGNILVCVGMQDICTKFHRVHPETLRNCIDSDLQLTENITKGQYKLYKCKNGMWDMATPIFIGDQQMGNLFIGQFFFENDYIDYDHFKSQALKYGFDQKEYLDALEIVPRSKKEDIDSTKNFFSRLANSISKLSYSTIKLSRSISEIELSKKLLTESKAHLEKSQEIAHLGSWELDLIDNKLTWSDEVYRIFGLPIGEFKATYEAFLDAVHPDDRIAVDNVYSGSLKEKKDRYEIDHRVVRKNNGEIRYVHEKCEHFRDNNGNVVRSVGMVHDITESKIAEKKLQESSEKLNIALETGNIGVWEWNMLTDEMTLDDRMLSILVLEAGTFGGTYKDFENLLNEEDIPHFKSSLSKAVNENATFETVLRVKVKNEEDKYLNVKAHVEKDSLGCQEKMTGVCYDITDMKKGTEKVLFDLNKELLRSNKELEQFAYVASHDLQEPLRMVSSFTQLLSQRYKDKLDKDGQEYVHFAMDGAVRMQNQINDLLTISRIQTKGKKFTIVDMHLILEQVMKNLKLRIQTKNGLITGDIKVSVSADEGQMIQLLQNLVENALKYCDGTPVIHISSEEDDNFYKFSVKDNGIGIEQQYLERIFQIFQRLHTKEKYEGTGIGLAVCKRIVERHNGEIWVESELGKGSTFYFTITK